MLYLKNKNKDIFVDVKFNQLIYNMIIKVTCAIIVSNTKILAAKRSNTMPHSGYWEFPGGKIEDDELPEDCLIREIQEELDCTIEVNQQLPAFRISFLTNT